MKTRIITGLVLIPLLVAVLLLGKTVLTVAVAVIGVIGLFEFYKATGMADKKFLCILGYLGALAIPLLRQFVHQTFICPLAMGLCFFFLFVCSAFTKQFQLQMQV